jgi:hypothetical protein
MEWLESLGPWATLVKIGLILLLGLIARLVIGFSIRRSVRAILAGGKGTKLSGISQERIAQRGKTIGSVLDNHHKPQILPLVVLMHRGNLSILGLSKQQHPLP